jgi:tetratricopeptide (TPR) repeat protein
LRLPEQRREQPGSGTISLARLRHRVPASARKEVKRALAAERKGDRQAAVAHLEKAIAIDPGWMEVCNTLGARYLRWNRFEQAVEQFREALALDGAAAIVHANLGLAYLHLRRFPEAELEARQGLRYDSTSYSSRYVLGLALDMRGRDPREALENLIVAARRFPRARLVAAHILVREGERTKAIVELKNYLRSGSVEDREAVETWLARLEAQLTGVYGGARRGADQ